MFLFEEFSLAHLIVCLAKHFPVVARRCFPTSLSPHTCTDDAARHTLLGVTPAAGVRGTPTLGATRLPQPKRMFLPAVARRLTTGKRGWSLDGTALCGGAGIGTSPLCLVLRDSPEWLATLALEFVRALWLLVVRA